MAYIKASHGPKLTNSESRDLHHSSKLGKLCFQNRCRIVPHLVSVRDRRLGDLKDAGNDGWPIGVQEHPRIFHAMGVIIQASRVFLAPQQAGT